jgi:hypothetical protein
VDREWLLLRTETFKPAPEIQRDKYAHIHPVVRKYASLTKPEVKMGEPQWANAVMSRRWQREETLELDKKEWLARRERGDASPPRPMTCMTKEQDRSNRLAQQTLAMLREFSSTDRENERENIEKSEETK